MTAQIRLPGRAEPLLLADPGWAASYPPPVSRRVYAAAHVAASPGGAIDWAATLGFRDYLWAHGFAVAEAMDTAQRGMGLSWDQASDLIRYSAERAGRGDRRTAVGTDARDVGRGGNGGTRKFGFDARNDRRLDGFL